MKTDSRLLLHILSFTVAHQKGHHKAALSCRLKNVQMYLYGTTTNVQLKEWRTAVCILRRIFLASLASLKFRLVVGGLKVQASDPDSTSLGCELAPWWELMKMMWRVDSVTPVATSGSFRWKSIPPIGVAVASPTCELCAQTMIFRSCWKCIFQKESD